MVSLARQRILAVLARYVTQSTADGILRWALTELPVDLDKATNDDLAKLGDVLESGLRPFINDARRAQLRTDLLAATVVTPTRSRVVAVRDEDGVTRARLAARQLCQECGATSLIAQQAATCVSELARNILQYARVGQVELTVVEEPRRALRVKATDQGRGIPNLDEIYGGTYRSKTGQGRGINGVKRIANRFDLKTGPTGTTVEFDLWL